MSITRTKPPQKAKVLSFGSPDFVARFGAMAGAFTAKATSSKSEAIATLKKEGILTAKGNLTKRYASK